MAANWLDKSAKKCAECQERLKLAYDLRFVLIAELAAEREEVKYLIRAKALVFQIHSMCFVITSNNVAKFH